MEYVLMAVSIAFSVVNACLLHKFGNRTFQTDGDAFVFNAGISTIWTIILTVWFIVGGDYRFSWEALGFGVAYGVILCLFLYTKMTSMSGGPVSLTTLIGSCAFIIATGFGVLYASESINTFQIIGIPMILVSLVLCVNPKKSEEKVSPKWLRDCLLFFLAGGLVGILYKVFGLSNVADQTNIMMLTAAIVSAILFTACGFGVNAVKKTGRPRIAKAALIFVLLSGISSCVYIRLNISLSAVIPSAIFFPVSNGAMVILSTVTGKLFFKEKLNKTQLTGILIGLLAILIIGCGEAVWNLIAV